MLNALNQRKPESLEHSRESMSLGDWMENLAGDCHYTHVHEKNVQDIYLHDPNTSGNSKSRLACERRNS